MERKPAAGAGDERPARLDRARVAVERDHPRAAVENRACVAARPEGAVEDDGAGSRREVLKHLRQHDGYMPDRSANGIAFAATIRHRTHTPHHEEPRPRFLNSSLAAAWAAENASGRHS